MKKVKKGIIDTSALSKSPEPHEINTAEYFANLGYNIIFIRPSNIKGMNTPDFVMNGRCWEVKSPIVYGKSSFEDNFKKAVKQSEHVIYDLRRLNIKDEVIYVKELEKRKKSRNLKTLIIIRRDGQLLTSKGRFDIIKLR